MPYIKNHERPQYDEVIEQAVDLLTRNGAHRPSVGHINYVLSSILWSLFRMCPDYQTINDLCGVLTCVQSEFARRMVAPYEDRKITENGDLTIPQERAIVGTVTKSDTKWQSV